MSAASRLERPLPEFDVLASMAAVLPALRRDVQPALPGGGVILAGRLCSMKGRTYGPPKQAKSSVLATYELYVDGHGPSATPSTVTLHLRAFLDGRGCRSPASTGPGVVTVPELDAYAWLFPSDPTMPGLATLADPELVADRIPAGDRIPAEDTAVPAPGHPIAVTCLRYKPEDRCTLRVTAGHRSAVDGRPAPGLVAKVFADRERAGRLWELGRALHRRSDDWGGALVVPRPAGVDDDLGVLWLDELAGTPPTRATLDPGRVDRLAAGLAAFHGQPPLDLPPRTLGDQLAETRRHLEGLAELFPDRARQLTELGQWLHDEAGSQETAGAAVIHGAFRLRQLLVDGDRVAVLDFDSLATGDPAEDLVDLALDLDPGGPDPAERGRLAGALLAAYRRHAAGTPDPQRLGWYLPAKLVKRAYWLRHAAHHRPLVAAELLRRIDRACDPAERARLERLA